ncbi:hypothetical protein FRC01_006406 [Tulasnella sp. 417]|nr:hypothetical protein FRC01_006406 [Tulasnella sp. 417]
MDSRLSEDFGNRPPSPLPFPPQAFGSPTSPLPLTKHKSRLHKILGGEHSDDEKESNRGPSASLPGPRNPQKAYFKTRAIIEAYLKSGPPEPTDQSSSCASIALHGGELPETEGTSDPNVLNPTGKPATNHNILSRMRMAVVKWQCRKQFFEFTSDPQSHKEQPTTHDWRQRLTLAEQLLSTSSKGSEWASLVVRRFNKTTARQIAGLRAILRLRVEEESHSGSSYLGRIPQSAYAGRSYELLDLLFLRSQPTCFFPDVISPVLRDWSTDTPWVIVWLVIVIPDFRTRVDTKAMLRYGRGVIRTATTWSNPWLTGLWLLLTLFTDQVDWAKESSNTISMAKLILHVGMEAFGNQASAAIGNCSTPNEASKLKVLYSILSTCLKCDGEDSLRSILPSAIILEPFVEACVDALCANGPMTCTALKAIALLVDTPTIADIPSFVENLPPQKVSALASCCMSIVLGGVFWDKSAILEERGINPFRCIPEEDAFDILCRLPDRMFSTALAAALDNCPVSLDPSSQDHLKLFHILEPLLWLSNMSTSVPEAHRALVTGGACAFLAKIVIDSPQDTWSWKDRAIWRVKGEATTCLGNIIEKMDQAEVRSRLNEGIIKAIADIRDNKEAPLMQRDQAAFTLRRYKAAAGHCDVEPLCKERLAQEPEDLSGGEGQDVRRVSDADLAISAITSGAS